MKRTRMRFVAVAVLMVVMLVSTALPAISQTPVAGHLIYFAVPSGPGGTYICNTGPPFVSALGSGQDNCAFYQSGAPANLVCGTLTTITFVPTKPEVPGLTQLDADGFLCR